MTAKLLCAGIFALSSAAAYAETIPFDPARWDIKAKSFKMEQFEGKDTLFLEQGEALANDMNFSNGIIEYDVHYDKGRGFIGAVWRAKDTENLEEFYIRPHQSGNPDAVQYTPNFNGEAAWQLYYGEGHSTAAQHRFKEWQHVKIVVSGQRAEIYLDDMEKPALAVDHLRTGIQSGSVGLKSGRGIPAHFANFSVTPQDDPPLATEAKPAATAAPGTVSSWQVSESFGEDSLGQSIDLEADHNWRDLASEPGGLANLNRINPVTKTANTVFARFTVDAEEAGSRLMHFGFSDRARIYLNGQLLYQGDNTYGSRDYRFLGTIGYFDAVVLPLKQGKNEVRFAVSETFGGWGVQARLD